jgi:hypothetical protein
MFVEETTRTLLSTSHPVFNVPTFIKSFSELHVDVAESNLEMVQ